MEKQRETKKINVHSGHRKRVKAKVREHGFSQLEDHQLLELLLYYSIPQGDTNDVAHVLINEFGSLEEVFKQRPNVLEKVKGVGENTSLMISAIQELINRVNKAKLVTRPTYTKVQDYIALAVSALSEAENEHFAIFCLDSAKRLKKTVMVKNGKRYSISIDYKTVIQAAIDSDAQYLVFSHNHPGGVASPSAEDVDTTRALCITMRKIGVTVVDHVIVGDNGEAYSMYGDKRFSGLFY